MCVCVCVCVYVCVSERMHACARIRVFSGYPSLFNSRRKNSVLKGPPDLIQVNAG